MTVYLKPNVQIEPLVNQWHAHPMLIAPHTAGMFTTHAHLSIMKSYIQMPIAHAAAVKDPNLIGGPFIDYQGMRVEEIKQLKRATEERAAAWIALAGAFKELFTLLETQAQGLPLASLYPRVPEELRGLVELSYDLHHRASFRLFEPLVYDAYRGAAFQSIALSLVESDDRPFIFSTPRLPNPDAVHLPLPFHSNRIEVLNNLKRTPRLLNEVMDQLEVPAASRTAFSNLCWERTPPKPPVYEGEGVRIRYFGHACVLLETDDTSILIDPLISYTYPAEIERFTYEDLPAHIDYVLISHLHHDHAVLETLLQLRERIGQIIVPRAGGGYLHDPCLKLALEQIGFSRVTAVGDMQHIPLSNGNILSLPFLGEHCDLGIQTKTAYHITLKDTSFVFFADSSSLSPELYEHVRRRTGPVDHMFIGLEATGAPMSWAYGPLFPNKLERTLDHKRRSNGSDAASALQLAQIFDVNHVCIYALGLEPWLNYFMALQHGHQDHSAREIKAFHEGCQSRGIQVETLYAKKEWVCTGTKSELAISSKER